MSQPILTLSQVRLLLEAADHGTIYIDRDTRRSNTADQLQRYGLVLLDALGPQLQVTITEAGLQHPVIAEPAEALPAAAAAAPDPCTCGGYALYDGPTIHESDCPAIQPSPKLPDQRIADQRIGPHRHGQQSVSNEPEPPPAPIRPGVGHIDLFRAAANTFHVSYEDVDPDTIEAVYIHDPKNPERTVRYERVENPT